MQRVNADRVSMMYRIISVVRCYCKDWETEKGDYGMGVFRTSEMHAHHGDLVSHKFEKNKKECVWACLRSFVWFLRL